MALAQNSLRQCVQHWPVLWCCFPSGLLQEVQDSLQLPIDLLHLEPFAVVLLHNVSSTVVPAVEHGRSCGLPCEVWLLSSASESSFWVCFRAGDRLTKNRNLAATWNRPSLCLRSSPCSSMSQMTAAHVSGSVFWPAILSAGYKWDPGHESTLSHTWHNFSCLPCWFSSRNCNANPLGKKTSLWQSLVENLRLLSDDSSEQQTPFSKEKKKGS